jgi:hypothetical protein
MKKEDLIKIVEKCSTFDIDGGIKYVDVLDYGKLVDNILEAINYTHCCTELNNCFKKGEVVIYQGVKMRITFIDNCQKIAHMYCVCDETDWKEVSLSKLTKII